MLKLCYGMGLRVSEIIGLKISDIDIGRMIVHSESGKGKKDRYVPLPQSVLGSLREYYLTYKPKYFLFEGQYGGQYSIRSVQAVFHTAMKKAKINKAVGIHGLRHSYATHLSTSSLYESTNERRQKERHCGLDPQSPCISESKFLSACLYLVTTQ